MTSNDMIQETFQYLSSPGKSSGDDQSTSAVDNRRNVYAFEATETEKFMHTPRSDEAPNTNTSAATLSPQSQPSPPATPPTSRKVSSITPILQRGRVLQDDEIAGNHTNSLKYPILPHRTPPREYGSTQAANNQSFLRYQSDRATSPNTAIHQNRVMTQHQARMIDPSFTFSDSPDANQRSEMMDGSNHDHSESNKVPVSMLWGNDMGGVRHPGEKPKRPLSAYNFYFQLERERIINSSDEDRDLTVIYTVDDVARLTLTQQRKAKENKPKEKRSHRKTHGKISFGDLARTIANKWKQLDKTAKEIFEGSASIEKERYRKELGEWNKQMKKWKDAASKVASTLQYTQKGGLSSSNHSHQDLNTSSHLPFHHGNHMVTPELPKRTVYQSSDLHSNEDSIADHHMLQALANQQRGMNSNGGIGNGSLSCRSAPSHMGLQQSKSQRAAALSGVLHQNGAGMLPPASSLSNRFNGLRSSLPRNNGMGLGIMEYGDEMGHTFGLNEAGGEDEYYMNDGLSNFGNNNYDIDDVTDETFRMAQMMLPSPNALAQRNTGINGAGGSLQQQQQRRLFNQRRMKMLMMMQQKYNRDQMLMMQMGQYNGSASALGLSDGDNYDPSMDDPQQHYIDQMDDAGSYVDHSSAANHLMMNHATAAAAAAAFGRSQQHRQFLQQHQSRLVDELNASNGMDEQYHPMSHLLHGETFDERA